ncbi:MAG: DUF3299 domain-containing protein [Pseudomonadota bacterium]
MSPALYRRAFLFALGSMPLVPGSVSAKAVIDLGWADLLPEGQVMIPPALQDFIQHDGPDLSRQQPPSTGVRTDWNGETVRLPGFMVPIDFSGTGVTAFILVPYVGACVHVPPPPANQLVFVTTKTPYESAGLFEAVSVVGLFGTTALSTEVADVAYALAADQIAPF